MAIADPHPSSRRTRHAVPRLPPVSQVGPRQMSFDEYLADWMTDHHTSDER